MKKKLLSIIEVKDNIESLQGKLIAIKIYKGRKKYLRCEGEILEVHPSVFTLKLSQGGMISCSYNDIICGTVSLALHPRGGLA